MNTWLHPLWSYIHVYVMPNICICFCGFLGLVTLVAPRLCFYSVCHFDPFCEFLYGWWAVERHPFDYIYLYIHMPNTCTRFLWVHWPWVLVGDIKPLLGQSCCYVSPFGFLLALSNVFIHDEHLVDIPSDHIYMYIHMANIFICFVSSLVLVGC